MQPGDKTAKKTPVLSCNHGVHSFLREVEPYPIILGGGLSPLIATALFAEYGSPVSVAGYMVAMALLSAACTFALRPIRANA